MQSLPVSHLFRSLIFLCLICAGIAWGSPVREPKIGSPQRKKIMEIMRDPVSKRVGKRVTFTGSLKVCGNWAAFTGDASPSDGVAPKGGAGNEFELDFFALLQMMKGEWKLLHWGFAGDISAMEAAREKFPAVPKELVPDFNAK